MTPHRLWFRLLLVACPPALLFGAALGMEAQDSVSTALSGPIGDAVYSETVQTGPSSSLLPGGTNLLNPFVRNGVSDPLGFLIESSVMSPYTPEGAAISSYANAELPTPLLTDSTQVSRFSEYRNNRVLMSGAGSTGAEAGHALSSERASGTAGARMSAAASSGFGGATLLAPFAAGSSALAARQSSAMSVPDPAALSGSLTASASLTPSAAMTQTGPDAGGSGDAAAAPLASGGTLDVTGASAATLAPPSSRLPFGPSPGEAFPDLSYAGSAGTGFPDSTLGTAGPSAPSDGGGLSPLLSARISSTSGPFKSVSSDTTRYLNPTLLPSESQATLLRPATSLSELRRRAVVHSMIYNPGSPFPSPFEQRKLQRAYLRQGSGRRVNPISTASAPSIKP